MYLQIVSFTGDVQRVEARWSGGRLLWHGRVDVHQFLRQAVRMASDLLAQVGGADAYARLWGGTAFPIAMLERLKPLTDTRPRTIYEPRLARRP